jgi:hypothetical protein
VQVKGERAARQKLSVWQSRWPRLKSGKGEWSGEKDLQRECAGCTGRKGIVQSGSTYLR